MEKTEIKLPTNSKIVLLPEETVVWSGKAEAFPLMNASTKKNLTRRWLLCVLAFAAVTALYALLSAKTAGFNYIVELVILVVFGYLALVPVFDRKKLLKRCVYYVTDKRVLSELTNAEAFSLGRAGLKIRAVPAENGCVHLLFGAATELPESKYVLKTIAPLKDKDGDGINGIIYYNVKDTQELRDLLRY